MRTSTQLIYKLNATKLSFNLRFTSNIRCFSLCVQLTDNVYGIDDGLFSSLCIVPWLTSFSFTLRNEQGLVVVI